MVRRQAALAMLWACIALSGCAALPVNAPTAHQVRDRLRSEQSDNAAYTLIDIDTRVAMAPAPSNRLPMLQLEALGAAAAPERTDLIRPGDTLSIAIFEVGVSLFSYAPAAPGTDLGSTASAQHITVQVKDDGTIDLPYIGTIAARGLYPDTLSATIRERLRRLSQSPEALVTIVDSVENTAYVSGLVARPGRYRLSTAREKLLDVLTIAGGSAIDPADAELRIVRGDRIASLPLIELGPEDLANVTVQPGDRIQVLRRRKSYTVFGATDHVSQVPFESETVSLAEAVARVGGPSDARADARAIYLFRFEASGPGAARRPVIYRLDLMQPQSYFAAQLFQMQDKDVLLFANARANIPTKLLNVINQLFSPFVTVRAATTGNGL